MLTRAIAHTGTRRSLVALLAALPLGGLLSGLAPDAAAAERPIDRIQRRTQQRNRKQRNNAKNNKNKRKSKKRGGLDAASGQSCDVCPTCTYPTVQVAVADGNGPRTIRICPGTYTETITIGRPLVLSGAGQGTGAGDTILRGAGATVVTINPGVGPVSLQTLRIMGGNGSFGGGGVHHQGTALTMTNCTVTGNAAQLQGGGVMTEPDTTTLTMTGCTISDNQVNVAPTSPSDADGGGLFAGGNATLTNCSVSGNTATGTPGNGGGIYQFQGTLTLNNTVVTGNAAKGQGSSGGGIFNLAGTVALQSGSRVTGNTPDNCNGLNTVPGCSG